MEMQESGNPRKWKSKKVGVQEVKIQEVDFQEIGIVLHFFEYLSYE